MIAFAMRRDALAAVDGIACYLRLRRSGLQSSGGHPIGHTAGAYEGLVRHFWTSSCHMGSEGLIRSKNFR
jgi:hypothetical protein